MVYGRSGVHGVVTSSADEEPEHEFDRAQILHPHMVVTTVKAHHEKRPSVFWHSVKVKYSKFL